MTTSILGQYQALITQGSISPLELLEVEDEQRKDVVALKFVKHKGTAQQPELLQELVRVHLE